MPGCSQLVSLTEQYYFSILSYSESQAEEKDNFLGK